MSGKTTNSNESIRSGVASPTPSIRHISTTRVNNAPSSNQGQPPPNSSGSNMSETPSVNIEPIYQRREFDADSIIYTSNSRSNSRARGPHHAGHQAGPNGERLQLLSPNPTPNGSSGASGSTGNSSGGGLEYYPTTTSNVEDLDYASILPYYLPCLSWIPHYCSEYFLGDLIGGLSLVFFQLPLSLSYASSLAHVPIISGLYSLAIAPLIYMIFGSVPQMIVGPEGAISLIVGQAVEPILHHATKKHPVNPMEIVVVITFVSGASLLGFGLGRFGFLDNVLSASLLKGFISAVGLVMIINSSIVMLGLSKILDEVMKNPNLPDIHSPFDKFMFLLNHCHELHPLTFEVSLVGLLLIMAIRIYKKLAAKRKYKYRNYIVYIPEILIVVILSTWVVASWGLDHRGIEIIGVINDDDNSGKLIYNPLSPKLWPLMKQVTTSGFLCAMLGFFESTTALKSLGSTYDLPISSNRELVALGFINLVGSCFGALPAFGGYGRSKINAILARTTMSGGIMGICTILTIVFLMDYLRYIPKCTLNVVTCVIGISLIEEAPQELWFHWQLRGYNELITFGVTVVTTLFFSMESGIAVGLLYLLIRVIKHSAASRIQILGRIPGTNSFVNADLASEETPTELSIRSHEHNSNPTFNIMNDTKPLPWYDEQNRKSSAHLSYLTDTHLTHLNYQALEEIQGCLIIKIPEPLTFTNTSDLKSRLKRVEMYGSTKAHPGMKRVRDAAMTKYIIFDLNGMTGVDSSAAQILREILTNYEDRKIYSFFIRVTKSNKLRERFYNSGIHELLMRDLRDLRYFEVQKQIELERDVGATSMAHSVSTTSQKAHTLSNLTENDNSPYFDHISDALKVIDYFETEAMHTDV